MLYSLIVLGLAATSPAIQPVADPTRTHRIHYMFAYELDRPMIAVVTPPDDPVPDLPFIHADKTVCSCSSLAKDGAWVDVPGTRREAWKYDISHHPGMAPDLLKPKSSITVTLKPKLKIWSTSLPSL